MQNLPLLRMKILQHILYPHPGLPSHPSSHTLPNSSPSSKLCYCSLTCPSKTEQTSPPHSSSYTWRRRILQPHLLTRKPNGRQKRKLSSHRPAQPLASTHRSTPPMSSSSPLLQNSQQAQLSSANVRPPTQIFSAPAPAPKTQQVQSPPSVATAPKISPSIHSPSPTSPPRPRSSKHQASEISSRKSFAVSTTRTSWRLSKSSRCSHKAKPSPWA